MSLQDTIKDTSIAPEKDRWFELFDRCCFEANGVKRPEGYERQTRRLIEKMMEESDLDVHAIINYIDEHGDLPEENRIKFSQPRN